MWVLNCCLLRSRTDNSTPWDSDCSDTKESHISGRPHIPWHIKEPYKNIPYTLRELVPNYCHIIRVSPNAKGMSCKGRIFYDAVSSIACNVRMIYERWTGRYLEGSSCGIIEELCRHLPAKKLEKQDDRCLGRDFSRTPPCNLHSTCI
jgi:hypothetical protein